jgi:hypothetical protein
MARQKERAADRKARLRAEAVEAGTSGAQRRHSVPLQVQVIQAITAARTARQPGALIPASGESEWTLRREGDNAAARMSDPAELQQASDNDIIVIDDRQVNRNGIVVADLDDLNRALALFYSVAQSRQITISREAREYYESLIAHEGQHADAAIAQGIEEHHFSLGFAWASTSGKRLLLCEPAFRMVNFETTKLGLAAVIAAPADPSPGDIAQLQEIGYTGVADVAERVIEHNRHATTPLPMPITAPMSNHAARDPGRVLA